MSMHAPEGYRCPFCRVARGIEAEDLLTRRQDVFFEDGFTMAFIAAGGWKTNPGHALVISKRHFENIYSISDGYLMRVSAVAKRVALAMKAVYGCDGITLRQNNEPCGNQDVWHFHMHVIPRWDGDDPHTQRTAWTPAEREPYAARLREYFKEKEPAD